MSFQDHGLGFHQVITDGGCGGGPATTTATPWWAAAAHQGCAAARFPIISSSSGNKGILNKLSSFLSVATAAAAAVDRPIHGRPVLDELAVAAASVGRVRTTDDAVDDRPCCLPVYVMYLARDRSECRPPAVRSGLMAAPLL